LYAIYNEKIVPVYCKKSWFFNFEILD